MSRALPRRSPPAARPGTGGGFSMVEVLIGVALFVIGFVPVIVLLFGSEKAAVETQRGVQAVQYAHTLLEEVESLPYAMVPAVPRMADADFIARVGVGAGSGKDSVFSAPDKEYAENFDRSIEVIEGEDAKRVKVYVIDRHVSSDTAGKRGETLLETLVVR